VSHQFDGTTYSGNTRRSQLKNIILSAEICPEGGSPARDAGPYSRGRPRGTNADVLLRYRNDLGFGTDLGVSS
jgi:hypothetical protein